MSIALKLKLRQQDLAAHSQAHWTGTGTYCCEPMIDIEGESVAQIYVFCSVILGPNVL